MRSAAALASPFVVASLAAAGSVTLAEVRTDEPGVDLNEYIEISAPPGTILDGRVILAIGDDDAAFPPGQNGFVESVVVLSGTVGPSGRFVVAESTFALGTADQVVTDLNLEGADNVTLLLVLGDVAGVTDVDADDDGILDAGLPFQVLDGLAVLQDAAPDGFNSDYFYSSTTVGPDASLLAPAQAWRCEDTGAWQIGALDPASGSDTPGAANPLCGGGAAIAISEIRLSQAGTDTDEYFELVGAPGASLSGLTYIVLGDSTAPNLNGVVECVVSLEGLSIPGDGTLVVAESTFTLGTADVLLDAASNQLNFEDSDNVTHMIVAGWSGTTLADVDAEDDCVIEAALWTSVVDSVSIVGTAVETGCVYSETVVGPDGNFVPGHVYKCDPKGQWRVGAYSATAGGDTPGATNLSCSVQYVLECGQAEAGTCDSVHATPYCSDTNCCNAVCIQDPTCCQVAWDADCVALVAVQCASGTASCESGEIRLNEIRVDQTGTDNDEYIEIGGPAGASLDGLTHIVIGDSSGGLSGVIEAVVPLTGQVIASDGLFLVAEPTMTLGVADYIPAGANILNFENTDNVTHLLVSGFTGALNQDLDTDNNGTLDLTPWSAIVDGVAIVLSNASPPLGTEWAYSTNKVGPDGTFAPGVVWRCQDTGCWNIGAFDPVNPAAGYEVDTPGNPNIVCEPAPACPTDLDGDGLTAGGDLAALLANWAVAGAGDFDGDGVVGGADLSTMLAAWGDCPN